MKPIIKKFIYFIFWGFLKRKNYSQSNEESILEELFNNQKRGFFVDVGAYHPFRYSNTALLYKKGWNGINIDAEKSNMRMFRYFRKRDVNLNIIVSNNTGQSVFYYFNESAYNGILSKNRLKILHDNGIIPIKTENITSTSLGNILELHVPRGKKIDLLTIDIEGQEFNALKSVDLKKYNIKVILTEFNENKIKLNKYLEKNGFYLFKTEDRNGFYLKGKS